MAYNTTDLMMKMGENAMANKSKYLVRCFCVDLCVCTETILALDHWIKHFISISSEEAEKLAFGWQGELVNKEKQRNKHLKDKNKAFELEKRKDKRLGENDTFIECIRFYGVDYKYFSIYFTIKNNFLLGDI